MCPGYRHGTWFESKIYRLWHSIKQRCRNKNHPSYRWYGAKGIDVCKRWEDFVTFRDDVGEPPTFDHTLDRIDSTKNYEPANCRWATMTEQNNNTSRNVIITFQGKTQTAVQWARELNIPGSTIRWRVSHGYSVERVLENGIRRPDKDEPPEDI